MVSSTYICLLAPLRQAEGQEGPLDRGEDRTACDQRKNYRQLKCKLDLMEQQNEKQNNSRLLYRIAWFLVHLLANLNRVECKPASTRERDGFIGRILWVRRYGFWSNLLFISSLISLANLIYVTYSHYRVDFALSRMEQLILMMRAQFAHAKSSREQMTLSINWDHFRQIRELNETVAQRRVELKRVGSPWGHLRFAIENMYVGHILFTILSYISPGIYMRWLANKDHYLLVCFDDYKHELMACAQLIGKVVRDYQISARNFARAANQRLACRRIFRRVDATQGSARVTSVCQQQADCGSTTRAELKRARQLALQLDVNLARAHFSAQLVPFNRLPKWVATRANILLLGIMSGLGACIIQDTYVLGTLYIQLPATISHLSWPNMMVFLDMAILVLCINVSTIFFANLFVITVWDQTRLSNKLLSLMTDYLVDISQQFHAHLLIKHHHHHHHHHHRQQTEGQEMHRAFNCWQHQDRANSDLLELLVHYKLFVRQLAPVRQRLSISLVSSILILFILPISSSIHVPYYPSNIDGNFRMFIMVMSIMVGVPTSLLAFPACHMHARCLKLQRMLNNLTAHVAHVQSQPEFRFFYDEHLVSILRRESTSERARHQDQFAFSFGSRLQFDYKTVLQIYLWFGFILISLSFSGQRTLYALRAYQQQVLTDGAPVSSRVMPFVSVLDDPLGLYSG